jgi:thymidylate synthase
MNVISARNATDAFLEAVTLVLTRGRQVAPRGLASLEVVAVSITVDNPVDRLVWATGRVINPAFAVAESVWVLSGDDEPWVAEYNSHLRQYMDEGRLHGAYGPRIRRWSGHHDQLATVIRRLEGDQATRQAAIQIWDPVADSQCTRDVPCTISHRFLLRDGRLSLHTTMRSQDAWLGLPYDLYTNSVLLELLAGWVGAEAGTCYHTIDSLHLYEPDLTAARSAGPADDPQPRPGDRHFVTFDKMAGVLDDVRQCRFDALCGAWRDDALALASYRLWQRGARSRARELAMMCEGPLRQHLHRWYGRRR